MAQAGGVVSELLSRVAGGIQGCGQAATLVMLNWSNGTPLSTAEVTALIKQGVAAGQTTDPQGATTLNNLQWLAGSHGVQTQQYPGSQWQTVLNTYAGKRPVVVGVANASAFGGSDAKVQGHYVTVVGVAGNGNYLVSDPNSPASLQGQTVEYSAQQFANAKPFGLLVPTSGPSSSGSSGTQGAPLAATTSNASCRYHISIFPGNTTCMDPAVDLMVRLSLVGVGVLFLVIAVIIFGAGDKDTPGARETAQRATALAARLVL